MNERYGPEISDLVTDYDPESLARRPVRKADVIEILRARGQARPIAVVSRLPEKNGVFDADAIDGVLVRSHLELQRLHEEFRVGRTMKAVLAPMLETARRATDVRPIRIVDIGCGLGFIARFLASRGELGDDVEILGVDYNEALVTAASSLARAESVPCTFRVGNAFALDVPAHIFISTGVLHHFRGDDLTRFFREHERAGALGFVHVDIRPSIFAPVGSWIFHRARMREPLAKWDGYWSAVRAHDASTLLRAARDGAPGYSLATVDANPGIFMLVRIFQCVVGARESLGASLTDAYGTLGRRFAPHRDSPRQGAP